MTVNFRWIRLPQVMHLQANMPVVNRTDLFHSGICNRWQVGGMNIVFGLNRALGSWNGAGHGIEHENPPQGQLSHRSVWWNKWPQFLDGFKSGLKIHP